MDERADTPINQRIASRLRALRAQAGLSLDALAARCGVSRSALSLIERAESSPTAVLLERVAMGLGVPLASLFSEPGSATAPDPVSRAADQTVWRDPASGYRRRNLSPPGFPSPIQLVEVLFPPRARVAFDTAAREPVVHQQVWVLDGRLDFSVGSVTHRLNSGDCVALQLEQPTAFHNPSRKTTRYAVVVVPDNFARR